MPMANGKYIKKEIRGIIPFLIASYKNKYL
jgi:hypothetical protein